MSEHKAVPNIRFKGFEDKWKDTIIGKLVKVYDGVHQTPKYKNNGVPFVSVENISNLYTNKFISKSDFENNFKNSKPTSGDLLMTRIGDVGTVNLVKNDNDLAYYVSLALLKPKIKDRKKYINSYFLMYLIESPRTKKELWKRTLHIAFPKKINKNEISKVNLCICLNWKEQQKIGNFFAKLDKLLDLQQQKIEKLELLKKALLQKLFPKHDAKIPEFRFKGFEGDWRSCDLGKIAKLYQPKTITQKQMTSEGYPVFGANGFIGFYGKKNHSTDQVTISARGENAGVTSYVFAPVWITGNSMVINVDKNADIDKHFLFFDLSLINLKKFVTGGAQPQLTGETLRRVKIIVTKIKEQQKIGNLLSKVDQLIELENKKLQDFQQVKKCLLQNMFVE